MMLIAVQQSKREFVGFEGALMKCWQVGRYRRTQRLEEWPAEEQPSPTKVLTFHEFCANAVSR